MAQARATANSFSKSTISLICTRNRVVNLREVENLIDGEAGTEGVAVLIHSRIGIGMP